MNSSHDERRHLPFTQGDYMDKLKTLRAKFDALPPIARKIILGVLVLAVGFLLGRCVSG
jgi:hypothetical protein